MWSTAFFKILVPLWVCFCLTGCAMIELKKEEQVSKESAVIVGRITAPFPVDGPIIVAAYLLEKGIPRIEHYTVLHEPGEYELMVTEGNYQLLAFWDKNSNLVFDKNEPAGQFIESERVWAPSGGVMGMYDFALLEDTSTINFPLGLGVTADKPKKLYSRQAGARYPLDDDIFSEENGLKGYWQPANFYKEIGGNIYFLEEYDPDKIPVLFVHGATGTPKGWQAFIDNIDRTRFQPWFFYYPSGARIKSMAYLMLWKLMNLQYKYNFDTIYITAHSMGGLVARSFIMDYGEGFPGIKLFIAFATPWGGDQMATYGVQQSPAVIPSWIDMQPEGEFIQSLYSKKFPDTIDFYMFYGHRGNRNPFRSNNDGTITLASLLDSRPQAEAQMNYGFDEDHTSIVTSEPAIAQYNLIINSYGDGDKTSSDEKGGYIHLNLPGHTQKGVGSQVSLLLRTKDDQKKETITTVYPSNNGNLLGPFPPGEYEASAFTVNGVPDKKNVSITLTAGETEPLTFKYTPDGLIIGHVTTAVKTEERVIGMPAKEFLPPDQKILLQSITVQGEGIQRTIVPPAQEKVEVSDLFMLRKDYCYKNTFLFFGLPAGEYQLTIKAKGYLPFSSSYVVSPGATKQLYLTELEPVH
jgi:pimeloyl-ACP methyl ester carboxylesterase